MCSTFGIFSNVYFFFQVRVEINQTTCRRISVIIRFPSDYPKQNILVELKSKTISEKLLNGIADLAERHAKNSLNKPQIIDAVKFISTYLIENPLSIVYDEIVNIKKILGEKSAGELKLKQKESSVVLIIRGGNYFFKVKILVPENYPNDCIVWDTFDSNLPIVLTRFLNGQAKEIARQCVEKPLNESLAKHFQVRPSLHSSVKFLIEAVNDFHNERCPICLKTSLPEKAEDSQSNDTHDDYIERVYCGHLYHQGCLKQYMSEPPFPKGGKLCPAPCLHSRSDLSPYQKSVRSSNSNKQSFCGIRLAHDRWVVNVKLAEARWAQQQARKRELEEVIDFLK